MEAMDEQGIKEAVFRHAGCNREGWCETCRLILAWAEATAKAEYGEWADEWRQSVLKRIGWKD